jgi:selT/selW/selH-like putative selenoprotein
LGVEVELIRGSGGVFDVVADGDLVFSKHGAGRFPNSEEVLSKLRK